MFCFEYCKILKNSFFYRTPVVATSVLKKARFARSVVHENRNLQKTNIFRFYNFIPFIHQDLKMVRYTLKIFFKSIWPFWDIMH